MSKNIIPFEFNGHPLRAITMTARSSVDFHDFRARCLMLYGHPGHQLAILFPIQ